MPTTPLYLPPAFFPRGFFSTEAFLALVTGAPKFVFLFFLVGLISLSLSGSSSTTSPPLSASPSFLLDPESFNNSLGLLAAAGLARRFAEAGTTPYLATIPYYLTP
jgi:hypothetical protein